MQQLHPLQMTNMFLFKEKSNRVAEFVDGKEHQLFQPEGREVPERVRAGCYGCPSLREMV